MTLLQVLLLGLALGASVDAGVPASLMRTPSVRLAPKVPPAQPVLAMMELNPWLMVIGSDSATFVLYDDGRVVYRAHHADGSPGDYLTVTLKDAERRALLAELDVGRLGALPVFTRAANATDMPTTVLITFPSGKARSVSVYGLLDPDQKHQVLGWTTMEGAPEPPAPSPVFLDLYRRLHAFSRADATPWTPPVLEVMVWDYDYAPNARPWPAGWPDLASAVGQPTDTAVGRIFVDGRDQDALLAFLRTLGEREAVLMNGRKFAIGVRPVIPGEELWRRVIPRSH